MNFNTGSKTFTGTPTISTLLYIDYGVTVTYTAPASTHTAISTFIILIQNQVASVATAINSASPVVGSNYTLQFDAGTFVDPEGDTLYYSAYQVSGAPLPYWAYFQPTTRYFHISAPYVNVL